MAAEGGAEGGFVDATNPPVNRPDEPVSSVGLDPDNEPLRGRGTVYIVMGMLMGAFAAYGFQVLGGRVLGADEFAPISVLWTIQFLVFTVLYTPMEQLIIRRLAMANGSAHAATHLRPLLAGVILGGIGLSVGFVLVTLQTNFNGNGWYPLITAVLFAGYGVFAVARGFLAGRGRYRAYGYAIAAEGVVRLVAAGFVLAVAPGAVLLAATMATGAWMVLVARPFRGGPAHAPVSVDYGSSGGFLTGLFIGNAASQTILAAGPIVIGILGAPAREVSVFFATFTLFRGPLTMSYALLARILPALTTMVGRGEHARLWRWSRRASLVGFTLAGAAGLIGYAIGPWLVVLLFKESFRPSAAVAALGAGGVVAGGMAFFVGQVLVAQGRTVRFARVWVTALVVWIVAIVAVPGGASLRAAVAFALAEVAALALTTAASRHSPSTVVAGHGG